MEEKYKKYLEACKAIDEELKKYRIKSKYTDTDWVEFETKVMSKKNFEKVKKYGFIDICYKGKFFNTCVIDFDQTNEYNVKWVIASVEMMCIDNEQIKKI